MKAIKFTKVKNIIAQISADEESRYWAQFEKGHRDFSKGAYSLMELRNLDKSQEKDLERQLDSILEAIQQFEKSLLEQENK